ncbi:MAG: ATP-binding cassette domain-containing protein [candidate division Zixibacteria bacterium]|nr:ATP-binding cassette domain-containing protein [candidate division Zixibacteria bacterium]
MIELRNIHFSYSDRPILKNVSFTVGDDEALVIMGPSGSGKSTILRLILGLECPQQGELLIDGANVCTMREKDRRKLRKKIGMVFQAGALFDSLTVGENVGYYLIEHSQLRHREIFEKVMEMLGFVGLDADEVIDKLPEELSGGMRRRVAIGRALLSTDPKIMLYDEPTTGLDPRATEKILDLIGKLHSEKPIASIMVTHQIVDALTMADRFVVIADGELAFDGNREQLHTSTNRRVKEFLKPFLTSFADVARQHFVTGVDVNEGPSGP